MTQDQLEKLVESLVEQQIRSKLTEQYISATTERVLKTTANAIFTRDQDNLLRFTRASAKQYIESVLPTLHAEIVDEAVRSVVNNRDNIKLVQDMFRQALGTHIARFVSKTATAIDRLLKEETL